MAEAVIDIFTKITGFTIIAIILEVAGLLVTQVTFDEVRIQVTISLFNGT